MIANLGYALILGKPLIMYLGILSYLCLGATAVIGYLSFKGIATGIPFKWHPRLALAAIILATIHALLGLAIYFNF